MDSSYEDGSSYIYDLSLSFDWCALEPSNIDDCLVENRKSILRDGYGFTLEIDKDQLREHSAVIESVKKLTEEGLRDMKNGEFLEAAKKFQSASSNMWPCHREKPMNSCITYYYESALARMGLSSGYGGVEARDCFNATEEKMGDGFYSDAVLQRQLGGPNLAMPCWTIIPLLYHAPPDYNMSWNVVQPSTSDDESGENRECVLRDGYGTELKIDVTQIGLHCAAMDAVEKLTSEALADMKSVKYMEAANKFESALSALWLCHKDTPLKHWIEIHRGHALVRAALLQRPASDSRNRPRNLVERSFCAFSECAGALRDRKVQESFNRSLEFSAWLGLAWTSFFLGNLAGAEERAKLAETRSAVVDRRHFRGDRDIDTIFLRLALCREIGTLPDDYERLCDQFGHTVSKHEVDIILVEAMDLEAANLAGNFALSVTAATHYNRFSIGYYDLTRETSERVNFMIQLRAGYQGNTWFAVGAYRQARMAYECASGAESVLVRAAASVGLGNVLMRLRVVKVEEPALVGNASTVDRRGTEASEPSLEFAEAEIKYKEALEIYDALGFRVGQIIVMCNLGNLHHMRKELGLALNWYDKARELFGRCMDTSSAALHLHLKLAELNVDMEKWVEAAASIAKAEEILKTKENCSVNNKLAVIWVEHLYGKYHLKKATAAESTKQSFSDLAEARKHLYTATIRSAAIQQNLGFHTSLRTYMIFEQQKETYALLLWCLALQLSTCTSLTSVGEILVWCERGRSRRTLSEQWSGHNRSATIPGAENDLAPVTDVDAFLATASNAFDTLPCEQCWKNLQVLLSRCELPSATTVVEYALCADFGFLIFVLDAPRGEPKMLRVSFEDHELHGEKLDREKLTTLVNRTVFLLHPDPSCQDDEELAKNLGFLYKLLFKPVEKWLENTDQIIVIPHEVLFKIPFHALRCARGMYLIERFILSSAESIRSLVGYSVLWELSRRRELGDHRNSLRSGKQRKQWLVVGINDHRKVGLRSLKFAEKEAGEIHRLLSVKFESASSAPSQLLRGQEATKDRVSPLLKNADIIHLATHGVVNATYERGGIIFAAGPEIDGDRVESIVGFEPPRVPRDSDRIAVRSFEDYSESMTRLQESQKISEKIVLKAQEISRMELKAQLVVLSACQSAEGVIFGEGVAGLGRALHQAMVPCSVLSLWPVSDKATSRFMTELYNGLLTGRPVPQVVKVVMNTMINAKGEFTGRPSYKVHQWGAFLAFGHPGVRVAEPAVDVQGGPPQIAESPVLPSLRKQAGSQLQEPLPPPQQKIFLRLFVGLVTTISLIAQISERDARTRNLVIAHLKKPSSKCLRSWSQEQKLMIFVNLIILCSCSFK